ncbi:Gfo/Idh/MocA family oxidoreductase [Aestuariivirga litoralis]|nr:Gfo/Idh/MocA family oxidoreductase [Aestuariivirga litoralis]
MRLLVLGTGGMAAAHAGNFAQDPRVEMVGTVDVVPGRAAEFAKTFGIAKHFTDLDAAIKWGQFDAAANVTPDSIHHPTTMKLLNARKHVFCEKPLAENFELANEMATTAEKNKLINMVNLTYRNVAGLHAARKIVADGELGDIRHVEASYRQSWLVGNHWGAWDKEDKWLWRLSEKHGSKGVLGDVGIHILDFTTFCVGMMPTSLQARLKTFHKAPDDKIGKYELDANDSAAMTVEFENGALGIIHASRFMTGYGNTLRLNVFGTKGALEIQNDHDLTTVRKCVGEDVHTQAWRDVVRTEAVETNYRKFITAVASGQNGDPSFRRAADLQKVLDACYVADKSGTVTL